MDAIVVVNNLLNQEWLYKGLKVADNVVLADGGANRFYNTPFRHWRNVRAIVGDFDSLRPEVESFYKARGVELKQVWNQDTNDFEKSVKNAIESGWNKIFCFGAFGGRMDHTLSSMHHATKLCREYEKLQIVLFGQTNLMYYLRPNIKYQIHVSHRMNKMCCGLIPFGKAEHVYTRGFKWNLGPQHPHQGLEWGEFISTSNEVVGNIVEIWSSGGLFFVCHFRTPD